MENVMTNGFTELSANELENVGGGFKPIPFIGGVALTAVIVAGCAAAVVATGGAAAVGIGAVLGGSGGAALAGGLIGYGICG